MNRNFGVIGRSGQIASFFIGVRELIGDEFPVASPVQIAILWSNGKLTNTVLFQQPHILVRRHLVTLHNTQFDMPIT